MARDVALRPILAVAANRAVDHARIGFRELGISEPQTSHHARPELLDEDIRALEQRLEPAAVLRMCFRSSARLFLPRLSSAKFTLSRPHFGRYERISSPAGRSILTTSAPASASNSVAIGPGSNVVKS